MCIVTLLNGKTVAGLKYTDTDCQTSTGKKLCPLYTDFNADSIQQILFECSSGDIVRTQLGNKVINTCPRVLGTEMSCTEMAVKTKFILRTSTSGTIVKYVTSYTKCVAIIYK